MKANIHPEYFENKISCVCGASWEIAGASKMERIDICSACHPFYTGKQKVLDTEGRIEKFRKKYAKQIKK